MILSLWIASKLGGINSSSLHFQLDIKRIQLELGTIVVPLSRLKYGSVTERSILFKYIADSLKIPTKLCTKVTNKCKYLISTVIVDSQDVYLDLLQSPGSIYINPSKELDIYLESTLSLIEPPQSILIQSQYSDMTLLECINTNVCTIVRFVNR